MATELAPANEASHDVSSDRAEPSNELDNPENLDFEEADEDQPKPEAEEQGTETDSETDAPEDGQEAETADDETETAEGDEPKPVKDDVVIDVQGEKLPLSELKSGYMRTADYTRKTQEIGNRRRELDALTSRVTDSVNAIADLLIAQAPKAPDPTLAMTEPGRYVQEKAMHEAAMAQINSVLEKATGPKEVANKLTQEQRSEYLQSENAKLAEAFPQTTKPETRKKFFDDAASVARDLGYSDAEITAATDHRMFKLAHYAKLGLAAEKAAAKAKTKVVNVPPMAPNKRQAPNASKVKQNQDAMKRLSQTGSIESAMAVDFD